jgi:hypothetical protein
LEISGLGHGSSDGVLLSKLEALTSNPKMPEVEISESLIIHSEILIVFRTRVFSSF